ncbi:MAG TPA: alpha/beta hydrolase [Usitatibacteraceae bacterium]|nr:alpha/beta hydrolase [Usitatibacteraceae bacterium]
MSIPEASAQMTHHFPRPAAALPFLAAFLLAQAAGCGGSGGPGGTAPVPPPVASACPSASAWNGTRCEAFATRTTERAATAFVEAGRPVTLEVVVFEPLDPGPHPAVVFHHGSTGNGDDPSLFRLTYVSETAARFFTARGWTVFFAQRRGRGASDGLYDEGFEPDRSRYSCRTELALPGVEHALQDADAALEHVRRRPSTDATRILLAGESRGGILAVAQAGRRPDAVLGAVNFVGGWLGEACVDAAPVNRTAFVMGAASPLPTYWIYAANDPFYSLGHSRANFAAFTAAGGRGTFTDYQRAPGLNGHFVLADPSLWEADLAAFLARAFPSPRGP